MFTGKKEQRHGDSLTATRMLSQWATSVRTLCTVLSVTVATAAFWYRELNHNDFCHTLFLGKTTADETLKQAEQNSMYGITIYLKYCGKTEDAKNLREALLKRNSVWPCIPYLAVWNDKYIEASEEHILKQGKNIT